MVYKLVLFLIILFISCNQKAKEVPTIIGDTCRYEKFSEQIYISHFEKDEKDSIININFLFKDDLMNTKMWLNTKDILRAGEKIFDKNTITDSTIFFNINGERLIGGSCSPYLINSIIPIRNSEN